MTDPNVTYKTGFAELVEKLGRTPTANECLPLHEEYKRAWGELGAVECVPGTKEVMGNTPVVNVEKSFSATSVEFPTRTSTTTSAAGPSDTGFSRKPAPQARSIDASTRAREDEEALCPRHGWGCPCQEALSGPGINAEALAAVSEPEPAPNKPEASERARVGTRGPGGGIVAVCEACGREWERPARRGRPARKCEECR